MPVDSFRKLYHFIQTLLKYLLRIFGVLINSIHQFPMAVPNSLRRALNALSSLQNVILVFAALFVKFVHKFSLFILIDLINCTFLCDTFGMALQ